MYQVEHQSIILGVNFEYQTLLDSSNCIFPQLVVEVRDSELGSLLYEAKLSAAIVGTVSLTST